MSLRLFPVPRRLPPLALCLAGALCGPADPVWAADDIQFNTDVLDTNDRQNIDLGQFSRGGYIMPGTYHMAVRVNKDELPEQDVTYYPSVSDPKSSEACLSPTLVAQLGLKPLVVQDVTWWHDGQCLDLSSLKGVEARGELATSSLYLSIPQALLEYSAPNWDPPSRWDNGIAGVLFDYNINGQARHLSQGQNTQDISGNGTAGANMGGWRFRADWQARYNRNSRDGQGSERSWDWSRYYLFRPIPSLGSTLTLGEDYLTSDIFDNFRFTGARLVSDDNMLPPNLRGYAPEVTGVAKTNAKVTISQQGRVLYETQVAAGPFRIQDINDAVSGKLDVRVEEQNGGVQTFQVDTANIPYLTRPGMVRYKLASGKPSAFGHHTEGPTFATGEFSWGINNGWSLFGGAIGGGDYRALSTGIGRDLLAFGALSFDVTESQARLPERGSLHGGSYRLNYSKNFEQYDSQVTFAGYRFSERNFMSMADYLSARHHNDSMGSSKELYTITLSKQFRSVGLSAYLNYSHQTYWDRENDDRYNLSLSRYVDLGRFKDVSVSLSAYRNKYDGVNDDGMYLSFSLPLSQTGTVSYNMASNRQDTTHSVGYYDRLDDRNNYQVMSGVSRKGPSASGFFTHRGDMAQVNTSVSYQNNEYSSLGLSLQGGATATRHGAALHRSGMAGGTRLMLDTGDVAGVPVRGNGAIAYTNRFGTAVITEVNSYYRNDVRIDLNALPDNVEATQSMTKATLTEGAIGYRQFDVISGEKTMAVIRLSDGSAPPFGAIVQNRRKQDTGIINDDGSVYLSGMRAGEAMTVNWDGEAQCALTLPSPLNITAQTTLLLPCQPVAGNVSPVKKPVVTAIETAALAAASGASGTPMGEVAPSPFGTMSKP